MEKLQNVSFFFRKTLDIFIVLCYLIPKKQIIQRIKLLKEVVEM